jgi:hypothetical protein
MLDLEFSIISQVDVQNLQHQNRHRLQYRSAGG